MTDLVLGINAIYKDAKFRIINNDYKTIVWRDERPQPTEAEIQAKIAELQAAEPLRLLRQQRDQLLAQTDWWVLPDRTATQAQLDYRQSLRDLPQNSSPELDENGNLINVNWPEKPQ